MANFEVTINPTTLAVTGSMKIREKKSTADYDEVPLITGSNTDGPTNMVIQRDQDWLVRFNINTSGIFTKFLKGGTWKVRVLVEGLGGAAGTSGSNAYVDSGAGSNTIDVNFAKGSLAQGYYRVVGQLRWYFQDGTAGPIFAFEDLGIIYMFED
jgi:hypothetical protein